MGSNTGVMPIADRKVQGEVAIVGKVSRRGEGDMYSKRGSLTHTGILRGAWEEKCVLGGGSRRKQIL
jgi:hypothetical protein